MTTRLHLVCGVVSVASCLTALSLWENPPGGRFIRQRREGIFHRLLAALRVRFCRSASSRTTEAARKDEHGGGRG